MIGMLQYNPAFRPTAAEALKSKVFANMIHARPDVPENKHIDFPIYGDD